MDEAMSPQARRRLNGCLHGQEWRDLAWEIAEALERASGGALILGEDERAVILAALKGETSTGLGDKLHREDGTHRSTPPTTSGRALERHQAALEQHMADGHVHRRAYR